MLAKIFPLIDSIIMNTPDEGNLSGRELIGKQIDIPVPDGFSEAVTLGELVIAAGDPERYHSVPLLERGKAVDLPEGQPRHWYLTAPSAKHAHGLAQIEFGISSTDSHGNADPESRFDHELFVDNVIRMNREQSVHVQKLYSQVGGFAVEAVRSAGYNVFAGVEIRYALIGNGQARKWAQLIYSRGLDATGEILKSKLKRGVDKYPAWIQKAVRPQNKALTAQAMALSALAYARNV